LFGYKSVSLLFYNLKRFLKLRDALLKT